MSAAPLRYAAAAQERFADDLATFVRFPSVGADPARAHVVEACARWLAARLRRAGLERVRLARTPGHPIVVGQWARAGARAPTVLVYGHYDVQPAEPLEAWRMPPFAALRRGEDLFGRGAGDDKGPMLCHVLALESHLRTSGRLPVNVVCVFDGEEEHGSPHLAPWLERRPWRPDVAVVSDMPMRAAGVPALVVATRGSLPLRIALRRPGEDVHSGLYGGAVPDAARAICRLLAALHDGDGRVAVPGFYDRVCRRSAAERARLGRHAPDDAEVIGAAGTAHGMGERGYTAYERTTIRPSITVTGVRAGHVGAAAKSGVPAVAEARLDVRLVDGQDPGEITGLVHRHLRRLTPAAFRLAVRAGAGARPTLADPGDPALLAAATALKAAFGRPPVLLRSGGTLPVADHIGRLFGAPTVLMGFTRPGDGMHGPDERAHLPTLARGTSACIRFLDLVARTGLAEAA